jgi:predicted deacylase
MVDEPPQEAAPTDRFRPLLHRWKAAQFPDTPEKLAASPIANFSERTLFELTRVAGFTPIHLELHIDMRTADLASWKTFLETSPHPWAPALTDILAQQFTPPEQQYFEEIMRPLVESGRALTTIRTAYITASKP